MNFTFTDVSSTFLNMVQQDVPKEILSNSDNGETNTSVFDEKLSKTLEKTKTVEDGKQVAVESDPLPGNTEKKSETLSGNIDKTSAKQSSDIISGDSDKILNALSEKLSLEEGKSFLTALQNIFLLLSNGNLKNVSIDAEGLEALKKMLLKAGFKENDINDLITQLSEKLETSDLTLDDLFNDLFNLPFEENFETESIQETYIETSASPFIESILNSLGIPKENVQEIILEADKGEKGISLDVIIEKLESFQKESFYSGTPYKTQEGDENFKLLLKQLGFEQYDSKTSPLTLNEFVDSLSTLRQELSQQKTAIEVSGDNNQKVVGDEKSLDLFKALFKGLELNNKPVTEKAFEFSYEQVKDQFENEWLIPDKDKKVKNDLFVSYKDKIKAGKNALFSFQNNAKNSDNTNIQDSVKETGSILNEKSSLPPGEIDPVNKNSEILTKSKVAGSKVSEAIKQPSFEGTKLSEIITQPQSETAKPTDSVQITTLDTKTNDTQTNFNILKTKASFKNLPAHVTQQVSKSLVRAINQGENTLRIQLKPPELGRLVMTIENTGNSMKVSIVTESHAAKEIITSNANELKSVLSNSGVNLEKFDVDMNSDFKQSMADAKSQAGKFGKRNQNKEKLLSEDTVNGEGMNDPISLLDTLNQDGSLHFVA